MVFDDHYDTVSIIKKKGVHLFRPFIVIGYNGSTGVGTRIECRKVKFRTMGNLIWVSISNGLSDNWILYANRVLDYADENDVDIDEKIKEFGL